MDWFKRLYLKLRHGEPIHWTERERALFRAFSGGAQPSMNGMAALMAEESKLSKSEATPCKN